MNKGQTTRGYARYLACDIHREYILMGGQNEDQMWVLTPRRISLEKFPEWAKENLRQGDIVVLETTTNVWETYDVIAPLVSRVLVANAASVGEIVGARVKTDKEDIKRLLKLLIGGIVPEVWVPPPHVRELRAFVSYRSRLVKTGVMIRNRLQSLLLRQAQPDVGEGRTVGSGLVGRPEKHQPPGEAADPPGTGTVAGSREVEGGGGRRTRAPKHRCSLGQTGFAAHATAWRGICRGHDGALSDWGYLSF